ncbi:protein brown isoform X1 [Wyeomyia smithii]|uniref:protein brown isoform X1 n=1 Tax=Wyeomyia smithii TaxID=174621 RepID=UPI002467DF50|nr:protein brown isoform X1 [Wyeomyia smithii]
MQLDVKLNQTPRTSAARESSSVLLQWKDLSVSVASRSFWKRRNKLEEKHYILKDANGALRSGNLMAAMGASGSGKTTMLAAVSMRMTADYVQGQVFVNGLSVGHSEMKRLSGFVPQFEISVNSLTVREQLTFVSKLKGVPLTQMRTVIRELNLEKCEQTRISHLSGGERRKINLAGELLTEPPILFCDEPTTGLDSFSALSVLKSLQKLATVHGKAVICTIHHPASAVFECFSDVILLRQGQVIFQGPTMEASSFFNSIQFPLPVNCNPADHYFKLVCDTKNDAELSLARQARRKLVREFHTRNVRDKCFTLDHHRDDVIKKILTKNHQACWSTQLWLLLHRGILDSVRNIREYVTVTLLFLITSVTISTLYFQVTPTNQTAIQDIRGALFLMLCELLYTISYAVFYMFPQELPLLRREVGEQTYRLSAYYAHKALLTVPKAFFESFLFVGIIYGCVKFATGFATYLGMATVCSFASLLAVAYGYLFSCICGSVELSIEYANIIFLLYALLGGLYLNVRAFPVSKFVSFFFFASEGISVYYWRSVGNITCAEPGRNSTTCLPNGQAVLEDAGYRTTLDAIYGNYLLMVVEILLVHFVAYLSLRRFVRRVGFY